MTFSVVIPTYRRPDTLFSVLDALAAQKGAPEFEVFVVDDGSGGETPGLLAAYRPPYPFRFVSQDNGGPAAARNRGVREARGKTILFLGDDTVPEPELLAVHGQTHAAPRAYPVAVLGYTTWPRELAVSPFLHHINEYGLQFGYGLIDDPEAVPFNFFYTSNVSLPRDLLMEALPGVHVTVSSDITREFREFERASTTTLSAYVQPVIDRYIARFRQRLGTAGFRGRFSVMQSNGGRLPAEAMRANAINAST